MPITVFLRSVRCYLISLFLLSTSYIYAQQFNVEISGVGTHFYPIVVSGFVDEDNNLSESLTAIIRADLVRSSRFRIVDIGRQTLPEYPTTFALASWKTNGASALVSGNISRLDTHRFEVRFHLFDLNQNNKLGGFALTFDVAQLRLTAHKISDAIYQMLFNEPGVFATRLSYVIRTRKQSQLIISDADSANPQVALTSKEPIISPAWSPDGNKIAYVSFETRKPIIYIHDLSTGKRRITSNMKGSNSAPAWSPDSNYLALALSRDGNTQIYKAPVNGKQFQRMSLSTNNAIDTEPQFSPDGHWLYFTSDRGGSPQIYRMSAETGERQQAAVRITFTGHHNTSPRIAPNGKQLAFISRSSSGQHLIIQNLVNGEINRISRTDFDESPTFSANGQYILYATHIENRRVLVISTVDGKSHYTLPIQSNDVREPAWGPLAK